MKINVTKADLIGKMEGYPLEVFDKMLERQFEQYGKCNMTAFQRCDIQGFSWEHSPEGCDFWWDVIIDRNFDIFFARYPKQVPAQTYTMREAYKVIQKAYRPSKFSEGNPKKAMVHALINAKSHGLSTFRDAQIRRLALAGFRKSKLHESWAIRVLKKYYPLMAAAPNV